MSLDQRATIDYTETEIAEIERVNGFIKPAFGEAYQALIAGRTGRIRALLEPAFDQVCDGLTIDLRGAEHVTAGDCLLAASHPGFSKAHEVFPGYAPPMYMMLADYLTRHVFKKTPGFMTRETGSMKAFIDAMGYISIPDDLEKLDTNNLNDQVIRKVEAGGLPIVCPEGNYYGLTEDNTTHQIGPLHKGVYHFAKAAKVPVVPVSIKGLDRGGSTKALIEFGEPLETGDFTSAGDLVTHMRERVFAQKFGFELVETRLS